MSGIKLITISRDTDLLLALDLHTSPKMLNLSELQTMLNLSELQTMLNLELKKQNIIYPFLLVQFEDIYGKFNSKILFITYYVLHNIKEQLKTNLKIYN